MVWMNGAGVIAPSGTAGVLLLAGPLLFVGLFLAGGLLSLSLLLLRMRLVVLLLLVFCISILLCVTWLGARAQVNRGGTLIQHATFIIGNSDTDGQQVVLQR